MRIGIVSDLHSELPNPQLFKGCEALIIVGDLCPDWREPMDIVISKQINWIDKKFNSWAVSCGFKKDNVYVIPGNHDISFQEDRKTTQEILYGKVIINEIFELGSAKFWGTPYTFSDFPKHPLKHWSFGLNEDKLWDNFMIIPNDIDYLCSHMPPYGCLDIGFSGKKMTNFGSHSFRKWLEEKLVNYPRLKEIYLGHLHEWGGHNCRWTYLDRNQFRQKITLRSVCLLDDGFCMNRQPYTMEL